MNEEENTRLVQQTYQSIKAGDIHSLLNSLAADVQWQLPEMENVPFAGKWRGRERGEGKLFVDEEGTRARPWETARRVLQAAAVEAFGRPGAYVTRDQVMQRANMADTEHFITIAKYLEERGWIADADADYGVFVVTASGIDEATK